MFRKIATLITLFTLVGLLFQGNVVYAAYSPLSDSAKNFILKLANSATRQGAMKLSEPEASAFFNKINEVSQKIGISADELAMVMNLESAGTFSPTVANQYGYKGLIQFGKDASVTVENLRRSRHPDIATNCSYNNITRLTRVQQMDCVYINTNFWLAKSPTKDMAALYASVNYPATVKYSPNQCWYHEGSSAYAKNSNLNPNKYRDPKTNLLCVTKNTANQRILNLAIANGYDANGKTYQIDPQGYSDGDQLTENDGPEIAAAFNDYANAVIYKATEEELQLKEEQNRMRQIDSLNAALTNTLTLPNVLFPGCGISNTQPGQLPAPLNNGIVACTKSILNYAFLIAVIFLIVSLITSNLGTIVTSGANGSAPIKTARDKLEKGLIGLLLIGAPYLILDLFSGTLKNFELTALQQVKVADVSTLEIANGLPDTYNERATQQESYLLFSSPGFFSSATSANLEFGLDSGVRWGGGSASSVTRECGTMSSNGKFSENTRCKTLNVEYAHQVFGSNGERSPDGVTACGAASVVMIANFLKPQLFNHSTGNNANNLSLRDNIFTASSYFRNATSTMKAVCNRTATTRGSKTTVPVSGAWSLTSTGAGVCDWNGYEGMSKYLQTYGLTNTYIPYGPMFFRNVRDSIDTGNPVLLTGHTVFGHVMVIKGYVKSNPNLFIINDPWGNGFDPSSRGDNQTNKNNGNGIIYNLNENISRPYANSTVTKIKAYVVKSK